ncbi:MAG: efflux RND transporter periplasmic adaptor subunit, partial [Myxococcales bacterium]|nr:efflux RND transporter periplasmic adaptor subunit [Myxococcales bacterium]
GPKSPDGKTPDKNETTNGKKTNGKKTNGKKTNGKKTNGKKTNGKKTPTTDEPEKTPTTPQNHDSFRMVGERFADEGSLVQPNAKLLSLIDIRTVVAVIYATEKDYIDLKVGQVATARTYVYKNRHFTGHVVRIAPLVKESSRLARIELEFPNPDLALKPGMFVRIEVNLETADNSTLIPRSALVRHQEKDGVFSVDPNTRTVKFIPIKIGIQEGGMVQVLSPALSGQVVTMGYHLLRDGAQVTVAGRKKRTGTNKRNGKSSNGSRD